MLKLDLLYYCMHVYIYNYVYIYTCLLPSQQPTIPILQRTTAALRTQPGSVGHAKLRFNQQEAVKSWIGESKNMAFFNGKFMDQLYLL